MAGNIIAYQPVEELEAEIKGIMEEEKDAEADRMAPLCAKMLQRAAQTPVPLRCQDLITTLRVEGFDAFDCRAAILWLHFNGYIEITAKMRAVVNETKEPPIDWP